MVEAPRRYGVDICYGTCQIDRCLETIQQWEPGLDGSALYRKIRTEASAPGTKLSTLEHFVRKFFGHRFLTPEGLAWTHLLKFHASALSRGIVTQIMYLLSARFDPMVRDFVLAVYWPRVKSGQQLFTASTSLDFLEAAAQEGRPGAAGSDLRLKRNSSGINGICTGFGLWKKQGKQFVATPPVIYPDLTLLLACELHERGFSDKEVVEHRDWGFFGLTREEVLRELKSSRYMNAFLVQASGDIVNISWKKTMVEVAASYD